MMFYANLFRIALPYLAPLFIGLFIGGWATVKFYKAAEVSALERTIEEYKTKDAENRERYRKFAEEKKKFSEKVIYVEKPHYVDCRPDGDWLREFNAKIAK